MKRAIIMAVGLFSCFAGACMAQSVVVNSGTGSIKNPIATAVTVGTGGSITPSGSGTVTANLLPVASGFLTAANGQLGQDSATGKWHVWENGADAINLTSGNPASDFPTLNQSTTGNAATATALASTPTGCTNQFAISIAASGNLGCAGVSPAYLAAAVGTGADIPTANGNTSSSTDVAGYDSNGALGPAAHGKFRVTSSTGVVATDAGLATAGLGHPIEVFDTAQTSCTGSCTSPVTMVSASSGDEYYTFEVEVAQTSIGNCTSADTLVVSLSYEDADLGAAVTPQVDFALQGASFSGSGGIAFSTSGTKKQGSAVWNLYANLASAVEYQTVYTNGTGGTCSTHSAYSIRPILLAQ
jgi:hypothetical protein